MPNKQSRIRRSKKARSRIRLQRANRLSVHRTPKHIYAQVFDGVTDKVLASASSLDKVFREELAHGGNIEASKLVGKLIAERAEKAGIKNVAFDRSGFKYHGRVKALAEAARENGLQF